MILKIFFFCTQEFAAVCTVSDPTYDSGDGFEKKEYKNRASISTYAGFESVCMVYSLLCRY